MVLEKVEQIQAKKKKKVEDKNEAGLIFNVEVKERQEFKMAARFSWAPDHVELSSEERRGYQGTGLKRRGGY